MTEEDLDFKMQCYQNSLRLRWWLAGYKVPMDWSEKQSRNDLILLKNMIEEDIKRAEA